MLQLRDEIGYRIDRAGRALNRQHVALAVERCQPQRIGSRNGVGQGIQQFLISGAVSLQLLDNVDALLQNDLLPLELVHLGL